MSAITEKQIKILKVLAKRNIILGRFDARDLMQLHTLGFVGRTSGYSETDRIHTVAIWAITEAGRSFLIEERAGQ